TALGNLGELHLMKGDADKGRELLAEAVRIGRNIRSLSATSLPDQLRIVANLSMRAGDLDTAREHLRECITLVHEYNSRPYGCPALESVATLALRHADSSDDEAARRSKHTACTLFFAAQATRRKIGSPVAPSDLEEHEMVVKNLDSKMSEEEQKPLQNTGLAMSFSQACEAALAWLDSN
ncbi:MAG: hypothetical protein ACYTF7_11460, partial [Planctomycetota bacterium]